MTCRTPAAAPVSSSATRDGKYPALFDTILADICTDVVLTGVQMPRMNAIMERWIQTCRHELLDRTLIFNQRHLLPALHQYERHYKRTSPHCGISDPVTITSLTIRRRG
jgi:putative transposase